MQASAALLDRPHQLAAHPEVCLPSACLTMSKKKAIHQRCPTASHILICLLTLHPEQNTHAFCTSSVCPRCGGFMAPVVLISTLV